MNKSEVRLLKKLTALNSIRKLYNSKSLPYNYQDGETYEEVRDLEVKRIINELLTN